MRQTIAKRASRGRPSAARMVVIEGSILKAASDLFRQFGFDAVTMEAIAAEALVSKTTLYVRYPSKETLLEAVIRYKIREWSEIAASRDNELQGGLRDRLRHHARTIARVTNMPDVQGFQRLLLANADRFPGLSKAMYEAGYLYIVDFIRDDIEQTVAREGGAIVDADSVARHLVGVITGWILQESAGRNLTVAEVEDAATRSADLLFAARDSW